MRIVGIRGCCKSKVNTIYFTFIKNHQAFQYHVMIPSFPLVYPPALPRVKNILCSRQVLLLHFPLCFFPPFPPNACLNIRGEFSLAPPTPTLFVWNHPEITSALEGAQQKCGCSKGGYVNFVL